MGFNRHLERRLQNLLAKGCRRAPKTSSVRNSIRKQSTVNFKLAESKKTLVCLLVYNQVVTDRGPLSHPYRDCESGSNYHDYHIMSRLPPNLARFRNQMTTIARDAESDKMPWNSEFSVRIAITRRFLRVLLGALQNAATHWRLRRFLFLGVSHDEWCPSVFLRFATRTLTCRRRRMLARHSNGRFDLCFRSTRLLPDDVEKTRTNIADRRRVVRRHASRISSAALIRLFAGGYTAPGMHCEEIRADGNWAWRDWRMTTSPMG